jgi:superfamily II DNA or RNA helicase
MQTTASFIPGQRITLRGEDFLITKVEENYQQGHLLYAEGASELVRGKRFVFDTAIENDIRELDAVNTRLIPDTSTGYQRTKLFLETSLRHSFFTSGKIEVAHKAAIEGADYQYTPSLKALALPRPRILIADAVGLGKTVEAGILMAELIKRGQGQRILVIALKSILAQFQQEIWNRFAIPLVRLDSQGIERIKSELPSNKNPFDYFDKVIISIDTLKNNGKFKLFLEKSRWDIIVIDEVHTVANTASLRGELAQFLATRCEAMILTSATPHNGRRESFASIISMLEPTAIPRVGGYSKADVEPYYVRRFKNDIKNSAARDQFRDREVIRLNAQLTPAEIDFLSCLQEIKIEAINSNDKGAEKDILFSNSLFKSYLSSPEACRVSVYERIKKVQKNESAAEEVKENNLAVLQELGHLLDIIIADEQADSKYNCLKKHLTGMNWRGRAKDPRILVFAERIETLKTLQIKLQRDFQIPEKAIMLFHGSMTDTEQQAAVEDFGKEDSDTRVFLASDAGSQGVNLHYYCNHLFNYDIPWSIITLEQRNGRIDRFGQHHTPYIFYLVTETDIPGIKTDLHIIDKLTIKEEEVYQTLGDAGSAMKLYDAAKEAEKVGKALAGAGEDILFKDATGEDEYDYFSLFEGESETTGAVTDEQPLEPIFSFYDNDSAFYQTLLHQLLEEKALKADEVSFGVDGLVEVKNTPELHRLLYDLPAESKPRIGDHYQLSPDKKLVERAIAEARRKKGEWAKFQVLYDLHPIVRHWMNKIQSGIERDAALVVKTSQLPTDRVFYLFHGQISNDLGQAVLSDFFLIGVDGQGDLLSQHYAISLRDFVELFRIDQTLYSDDIAESELAVLQEHLNYVVTFAKLTYMLERKGEVYKQMKAKQEQFQEHLDHWVNTSRDQLALRFESEDNTNIFTKNARDKASREIETILHEKSRFAQNMATLNNDPYLKLLAVFYNL